MYLTVHRVRTNPDQGPSTSGFNTFLHLHGEEPVPQQLDPDGMGEHTGSLEAESIEVPPGGNFVDSYLDIVAPDGTSSEAISAVLTQVRDEVPADRREARTSWSEPPVAVRLVVSRRVPESAREEYDRLCTRALALLDRAPTRPRFVIRRVESADGFRFELAHPDRPAHRVTLPRDVHAAYEELRGPIFDAIPGLLLTPAELDELPEIQIVDAAGDQLWSSFHDR